MESVFRLSNEEFATFYSKVPRFNIDLLVRTEGGIVLIKRSIEPNVGCFHVPGGTLYKGETFNEAAVRIAKNETGYTVEVVGILGAMEFPAEKRGELLMHTVSVVLEVKAIGGELKKDNNAKEIGIFTELPDPGIAEHYAFLRDHQLLA